jgi:hypothetical protein
MRVDDSRGGDAKPGFHHRDTERKEKNVHIVQNGNSTKGRSGLKID